MPKDKRSHEENRGKVCAICWNERGIKPDRLMTETKNVALSKFLFPSYNRDDPRFPNGLCNTDRNILLEWINDKVHNKYINSIKARLHAREDFS